MFSYTYTKNTYSTEQLQIEIRANAGLKAKYANISTLGTSVTANFNSELTSQEQTDLQTIINSHTGATSAQQLAAYLDNQVHPFVKNLINTFAAENISMGITQAGKTGHVLALFSNRYPVPDATFQNSLKNAFDTGSLYIALAIIEYIRDNPTEYDGLSPFITDARLLSMKNSIETFLGLPLSS